MFPLPDEKKIRSRLYSCVLYPEDKTQAHAIEQLKGSAYSAVGILHDKDIHINEETGEPIIDPDTGKPQPKKPHYHFVIRFKNARYRSSLAKELQIQPNYLQKSSDFGSAVRYLLHLDHQNKYQYPKEELVGSLVTQAIEAMDDASEGQRAIEILNIIDKHNGILSVTELIRSCALDGRWSDLRRGGQFFMAALTEHNDAIRNARGHGDFSCPHNL